MANRQTEQHLQKTIQVKNRHIAELVQQLQQTQDLHKALKQRYLGDEQKLKEKVKNLLNVCNQLKKENEELIRKCTKDQQQRQWNEEHVEKIKLEWEANITETNQGLYRLRAENEQLEKQKRKLQLQLSNKQSENAHLLSKINEYEAKIKNQEQQIGRREQATTRREQQWAQQRDELKQALQQMHIRDEEQKKFALNNIESRIKNIMINI